MYIQKILISLLLAFFVSNVNAATKLAIGDVPPNYLGKDSEGVEIHLSENKGKIVIISFWASWCPPCLKELPILENIQNKLGEDQVKVVAVNYRDNNKQYRAITKQLEAFKLTLTRDKRGSLSRKFGVKNIPHLFIVGKSGKIIYQSIGYGDDSTAKIVDALNKELSAV
ncbi:TlpA family protein disulfide reductase [Marinagarivorans algicola]|uniref:TlpA family protein disulfide reductase n=1 Tax=Marinagarivorans algicola TaxID=1513270 RepID=UPI00138F1AEE|nr:TlpA disulfide reductase family protein [Marinagarivorans algicola]